MSGRLTGSPAEPTVGVHARFRDCFIPAMLVLRNLAFLVLVPGVIAGVVPLMVLAPGSFQVDGIRVAGFLPLAAGVTAILWCMRDFWKTGHGTPAPIDPPKVLVVRGLYRSVRNPMYLSVLCVVAGEAVLCASLIVALYGLTLLLLFHLFVRLYEEPNLRRRFGEEYAAYRTQVPRWIPKLPGATSPDS